MLKYIIEIRNRILLILLTWLASVMSCYVYKETLLFVIVEYQLSSVYSSRESLFYFIFTDLLEVFSAYFHLIGFISFYISVLYLTYHIYIFFAPSFFGWEYFYISLFLKINVFLFFFFISFTTIILLPYSWNFFLGFQDFVTFGPSSLKFEAKLSEYLSFYFFLLSFSITSSQLFSMLLFLSLVLSFNVHVLAKWRKFFYCIFLMFATVVSPPDVFSQIVIGLLFFITYELFVFAHCFKQTCVNLEVR